MTMIGAANSRSVGSSLMICSAYWISHLIALASSGMYVPGASFRALFSCSIIESMAFSLLLASVGATKAAYLFFDSIFLL